MREEGEELELVHETCDASPDDLPAGALSPPERVKTTVRPAPHVQLRLHLYSKTSPCSVLSCVSVFQSTDAAFCSPSFYKHPAMRKTNQFLRHRDPLVGLYEELQIYKKQITLCFKFSKSC